MPQAPWFKFFAADYMSSPFVQALDPEQELWYLRLMIASAISLPRGCLPVANGKLWRLAKAPSLEHFEKHCEVILSKFEKDEIAGLYRVTKIANQLIGNGELSKKRSEAGKKGAAAKWQMPSGLPSTEMANAIEPRRQNMADSDSDSDSDSEKNKYTPPEPKSSSGSISPSRKKKPLKTPLPENFGISNAVRKWALTKGYGRLEDHLEHFIGDVKAHGRIYVDWDQAFQNAIREDWAKLRTPQNGKGKNGAVPKPLDYTLTQDEAVRRAGLETVRTAGVRN